MSIFLWRISDLTLIKVTCMEKKSKANVITTKGMSIDGSIEGDESFEILAGW